MGILAEGAGAAEGMNEVLARLLNEQKMAQAQQQITEAGRHNLATEAQASRGLDINDAYRRDNMATAAQGRADALAETTKRDTNTATGKKEELQKSIIAMRPIGSNVTPEEATADAGVGVSRGSYGEFNPGNMGADLATGGSMPPQQTGMQWRGTQDQITRAAAEKDAASKEKRVPPGPIEDTPLGMVRIGEDGKPSPILGPDGKPLQRYHAPPQPIVIQSDKGPLLSDRSGNTKQVIGPDGKPVEAKLSGQETNRRSMADTVDSAADDAQQYLKEAQDRGLLGPLAGRTFVDFMAHKVGSTGNQADDELLGQLRMSMSAARSGFASLHGRGGANAGVAQKLEQVMDEGHMDYGLLHGSLGEMQKIIKSYAHKPGGNGEATPTGGGSDPYQEYLNRSRK